MADGATTVTVKDRVLHVHGFKPFEVYFERRRPIEEHEVAKLAEQLGLTVRDVGLEFQPEDGPVSRRAYDGARFIISGHPLFFRPRSVCERILRTAKATLGACVYDDTGAHWFLDGLELAPDFHHCHWVGRCSDNCVKPA